MSESNDDSLKAGNQLLQQELAAGLQKGWTSLERKLADSARNIAIMGGSVVQNHGHPDMPILTNVDLVRYVKEMQGLLATHVLLVSEVKAQITKTAKFLQPKAPK
jgi:hypothetical protein